jgi:serpin B
MSTKLAPRNRRGRCRNLLIERLENRIYLSGEPIAALPLADEYLDVDLAGPVTGFTAVAPAAPLPVAEQRLDIDLGPRFIGLDGPSPVAPTVKPTVASGDFSRAVDAINRFAYELYQHFQQQQGNLFLSPMSIATALAMTYGGASGETAAQMAEVFHFGSDPGIHDSFRSLLESLNSNGAAGNYALDVANALWPQKDFPFRGDYLQLIQNEYGGGSQSLNYQTDAESARQVINSWVAEQTHDKIQNLIPKGALDATTRLVLTNAIYFKGQWATAFDPALTRDRLFYLASGQTVNTPTMHLESQFRYAEIDGYQVLEMLYKGGDLSMVIMLPRARGALSDLDYDTLDKVNNWLNTTDGMQNVIVDLPKFKMTVSSDLTSVLAGMGMPLAFDKSQADFSAMANLSPDERLYISKVLHKAFVEVNEEGTEAAAATAVIMCCTSCCINPPSITRFTADHAFHFFIRDNHTGTVLFMGRMTNPTVENNDIVPTVGKNDAADKKAGGDQPTDVPQPNPTPEVPIDPPYRIVDAPFVIAPIDVPFLPPKIPVYVPSSPAAPADHPLPIVPPETIENPIDGMRDSALKTDALTSQSGPQMPVPTVDRVFGEFATVEAGLARRFAAVAAAHSLSNIRPLSGEIAVQGGSRTAEVVDGRVPGNDRISPSEGAQYVDLACALPHSTNSTLPAARMFAESDDRWWHDAIMAKLTDHDELRHDRPNSEASAEDWLTTIPSPLWQQL